MTTTPTTPSTPRHELAHALRLPYRQYANLRYLQYLDWCQHQAAAHYLPLEHLVPCKVLRNFYESEWMEKVEKPLTEMVLPYHELDQRNYVLYMVRLYSERLKGNYPGAILSRIRRTIEKKQNA